MREIPSLVNGLILCLDASCIAHPTRSEQPWQHKGHKQGSVQEQHKSRSLVHFAEAIRWHSAIEEVE